MILEMNLAAENHKNIFKYWGFKEIVKIKNDGIFKEMVLGNREETWGIEAI